MAFSLPIRWRGITRGSAASRDIFLISKISHIIRHCKFVLQGACIFLKEKLKRHVFFKLEQKTRRRKNLSFNRFFHKLDNNKWKIHTGARTREQKYISIYISLCMKTFLKTGVYIYTRLLHSVLPNGRKWYPGINKCHRSVLFTLHISSNYYYIRFLWYLK